MGRQFQPKAQQRPAGRWRSPPSRAEGRLPTRPRCAACRGGVGRGVSVRCREHSSFPYPYYRTLRGSFVEYEVACSTQRSAGSHTGRGTISRTSTFTHSGLGWMSESRAGRPGAIAGVDGCGLHVQPGAPRPRSPQLARRSSASLQLGRARSGARLCRTGQAHNESMTCPMTSPAFGTGLAAAVVDLLDDRRSEACARAG